MTETTISATPQAIAHFRVDYVTHDVQLLSVRPIAAGDLEDIEVVPKP